MSEKFFKRTCSFRDKQNTHLEASKTAELHTSLESAVPPRSAKKDPEFKLEQTGVILHKTIHAWVGRQWRELQCAAEQL